MSNGIISEIELPNGNKYTVRDKTIQTDYIPHFPSMTGIEAVTTSPYYCARWNATDSTISSLFDGLVMIVRIPVAGSGDYGVGISVNSGDYHPVVYNISSSVGTRYGVNSTIMVVYNSTQTASLYINSASTTSVTGVWQVYDYDSDSDTTYRLRNYSASYINKSGVATNRRTLLFEVSGGLSAVNTTIGTGTSKTPINFKYIPYGQIRYYSTSGSIANNAAFTTTGLWEQYALDLRYSFNCGSTLTAGNPVYLRMVVNNDGTLSQDATAAGANPIVQVLPSTADGKVYLYLGRAGSTTTLELEVAHPIYEYKDGAIRVWTNTVGGSTGPSFVNGVVGASGDVEEYVATFPDAPYDVVYGQEGIMKKVGSSYYYTYVPFPDNPSDTLDLSTVQETYHIVQNTLPIEYNLSTQTFTLSSSATVFNFYELIEETKLGFIDIINFSTDELMYRLQVKKYLIDDQTYSSVRAYIFATSVEPVIPNSSLMSSSIQANIVLEYDDGTGDWSTISSDCSITQLSGGGGATIEFIDWS